MTQGSDDEASFLLQEWGLVEELTVVQAAMLSADLNPAELKPEDPKDPGNGWFISIGHGHRNHYQSFMPFFEGIKRAVLRNDMTCTFAHHATEIRAKTFEEDQRVQEEIPKEERVSLFTIRSNDRFTSDIELNQEWGDRWIRFDREPDWFKSTVTRADLKAWFEARAKHPTFFFPAGDPEDDDLPKLGQPAFAPELDLAIKAWRAVRSGSSKQTPKEAMIRWIERNRSA